MLSADSFKKFKRFMLNYEISKEPNKKFCPYPNCENVVEGKKNQT